MLGLAIIGGEGPEPAVCRMLARDADIVAAADSGLAAAEAAGLEPDWIIGDMDSLDPKCLEKYPEKKILRFPCDKDYTDTELALNLLWEKGCNRIRIAGGGGGRLDHLLAVRSLFERKKYPQRWITAAEDIFCLDSASESSSLMETELPLNSLVSVFPLCGGEWKAASAGLKWSLDNVAWDRGFAGISNRNVRKKILIRAISGRFMIILPINRSE